MNLEKRNLLILEFSSSLREYKKHWIGATANGIFCDLTNACDVLNHDILLDKMNSHGVNGNINSCRK